MGAGRAFTAMSAARAGAPLSARRAVTPSKSFFIEILQKKGLSTENEPQPRRECCHCPATLRHKRHFASSISTFRLIYEGKKVTDLPGGMALDAEGNEATYYGQSRPRPHLSAPVAFAP